MSKDAHNHKHFDKIKVERLPESEAAVTGEITLDLIDELRPVALKELNNVVRIDGFRSGSIPENVLIKHVGEMRILEEIAEVAIGQEYPLIMQEAKLSPVGRPQVAITKLAPKIALEFKITVALEPTFDLPDYKKIANSVPKAEIKDDAKEDEKFWAREKRRVAIVEAMVKETKISLPKVLVESELERMLAQFKHDVEHHKMKFDEYLKSIKKTEEDIKSEWREKAVSRVKAELIMLKIAEAEKLEPSKEELEKEAEHILSHHKDADPLRVRIYAYQLLKNQKVLEFLETL